MMKLAKKKVEKKEVDMSMYHTCRWCHNFDRFTGSCTIMSDELDIWWEDESAEIARVMINNPEEFSCCKWS